MNHLEFIGVSSVSGVIGYGIARLKDKLKARKANDCQGHLQPRDSIRPPITEGQRVEQREDENIDISCTIPKGSRGTITHVEYLKGELYGIMVKFDKRVKGLDGNEMYWVSDHFHPQSLEGAFWRMYYPTTK